MRILIAGKPRDSAVNAAISSICKHLKQKYECKLVRFDPHSDLDMFDGNFQFDYGISVGGDGTILHMNALFPTNIPPPPTIPFSLGSLGFLLPFSINQYESIIDDALSGQLSLMTRDRLECTIDGSDKINMAALNEVAIGRGSGLRLTRLQCAIDGHPLTEAVADGILVATGTGSTAYSLSAGGPIMHPNCSTTILTPICPRSLSFRPLVLPIPSNLSISNASSDATEVSMDGQIVACLSPGQSAHISTARHPLRTFARSPHEWIERINQLLGWNKSFEKHIQL